MICKLHSCNMARHVACTLPMHSVRGDSQQEAWTQTCSTKDPSKFYPKGGGYRSVRWGFFSGHIQLEESLCISLTTIALMLCGKLCCVNFGVDLVFYCCVVLRLFKSTVNRRIWILFETFSLSDLRYGSASLLTLFLWLTGKTHFLLRKMKKLFQHILDMLQAVPLFGSDYGHILRLLLPNVEYGLRMGKKIYNGDDGSLTQRKFPIG